MKPEMPEIIVLQFQRLRTRIRAVAAAGGVGGTLFLVATTVGIAMLLDIFFDLPVVVRTGMLLAAIGLFLIGVVFWIIRPIMRHLRDEELAAIVEHQYPELNERLLSAIELEEQNDSDASPIMKQWLLQETVSLSKRVDFSDSIDASRSVRRCWWGGIACLALLLPTLFASDAYGILVSRFFHPWGNYERIQNLVLLVVDGNRTVAQGSDVTLEVTVDWRFQPGTIPETAWLEWTTDDGNSESRRLDWSQENEAFSGTLPRVQHSFTYYISAARSRTRSYRIEVAPLPEIEELQIEITPPAYTGQPAQFHDLALGEIRVIEQSQWELLARFHRPVETVEILWLDGTADPEQLQELETLEDGSHIFERTEFTMESDKQTATLKDTLALDSPSGRFVIRGVDKNGLASATGVIRRLTIDADQAPLIQFTDHEENTAVRPDDVLDIPVSVADDFGLADVELHYEVVRSELLREQGVLKMENIRDQGREFTHTFRFDLTPLNLESGMRITLRGRATDERPIPEPNESWTITRSMLIRSDAKPYGEQTVREQQQRTDQVIETLKTELQQQKEKARQLEQEAKNANSNREDWESQDDVEEMREKLEKLQQQLEKLSALFEQQPLFDQIAEETRQIAEGKLQEASKSIEQAQQVALKQKPQEFAKASEQLEDAAKQLNEMQQNYNALADLQRDLLELERLANNTEKLATSVEDLEIRQQEMAAQTEEKSAEPEQQIQKKEWEAEQRQAWQDHQQLTGTLNDLFQKRPELADAAAEALEQQLEQLANKADELAQRQKNLAKAAERIAANNKMNRPSVEQNSVETPLENEFSEILNSQEQLADLAQQVEAAVKSQEGHSSEVAQASEQFMEQAQQASQQAQQVNPSEAAKNAQHAASTAEELADQLQKSDAPQTLTQAVKKAAQQQQQVADELQSIAEDNQAQQVMQQQLQQANSKQTENLANELQKRSTELGAQPIHKESQAESGLKAQALAEKAIKQMQEAIKQSQQNNPAEACKNCQNAAASLSQAATQARQASGQGTPSQFDEKQGDPASSDQGQSAQSKSSPSESPSSKSAMVPGEVGAQVAQASRQLNEAGKMLKQMGTPIPGKKSQEDGQSSEEQASQGQPMNGGEGENQQPGNQNPQSGQQPSTAEALRQAAQSMRQAAGKSGLAKSQQKSEDTDQPGQQSDGGTGNESSDFGSTQQLAELMQMQVDLSNMSKRDWGELPGELQTELLESSQKKPSSEYQKLIRRYFNDISKTRKPDLKPQQN